MKSRPLIICLILLCAVAACAPSTVTQGGPTLTPLPSPAPQPTLSPSPVPTRTDYESRNIPGCDGFEALPAAFKFTWPGIEEVTDANDWGYYRCGNAPAEVAALYHQKMTEPPYNWQEFNWVELPEGTLGVYYHAVYQVWLYVWILPIPSDQGSYLVVAQRDVSEPMELPCCG